MQLTISTIDATTDRVPADLGPVLKSLTEVEGAFFILAVSDSEFLQGSWLGEAEFHLEYFKPEIEGFHQSRSSLSLDTAIEIANRYRNQDASWMTLCEWEHQDLVEAESEEEKNGQLGYFEELALRHVIAELERNEIAFRVEPSGSGCMVFVLPEQYPEAQRLAQALFPQ
ncbi:MAG: hypothetical protein ACFCU3_11295 [Verrucomicrobiales bacterium]